MACVVGENSVESLVQVIRHISAKCRVHHQFHNYPQCEQVADLMPELPEEGHIVASLRPDDICQVTLFSSSSSFY